MRQMKGYRYILMIVAVVGCLFSCSKEDDIDEIFNGRFKITSYRCNAQYESEMFNELYKTNTYYLVFSGRTFTGCLNEGNFISGTWQADGENQNVKIGIKEGRNNDTQLSHIIYNILNNATNYSGDHNVIRIKQDDDNFIDISSDFEF